MRVYVYRGAGDEYHALYNDLFPFQRDEWHACYRLPLGKFHLHCGMSGDVEQETKAVRECLNTSQTRLARARYLLVTVMLLLVCAVREHNIDDSDFPEEVCVLSVCDIFYV
jgi:hypothetical protein